MADSRILVAVREHPRDEGVGSQQWARIGEAIQARGFDVRWAVGVADAEAVLRTEAGLTAALVAWDLPGRGGVDGEPGVPRCSARSAGGSRICRSSWS